MANTIKFNREDVVIKAKYLFWSKGFAGTSIRDIQDSVDMRPGSIYATFGSKEGLFKEALFHYAKKMSDELGHAVHHGQTPLTGLKQYVEYIIIEETKFNPSCTCMLFKANAEFLDSSPQLFEFSQSLLNAYEEKVIQVLKLAQEQDELPEQANTATLGQQFLIYFAGLRNYLNGRNDSKLAQRLIDDMFNALMPLYSHH